MKFITGNWTKKLIIVLIVLLLFNAVCPTMSYAWDIAGILAQPLYWLLLGIYIPIDISIGTTIMLTECGWGQIASLAQNVLEADLSDAETDKMDSEDIVPDDDGSGAKDGKSLREKLNTVGRVVDVVMGEIFIGPDTIFKRKYSFI